MHTMEEFDIPVQEIEKSRAFHTWVWFHVRKQMAVSLLCFAADTTPIIDSFGVARHFLVKWQGYSEEDVS